jgi:CDP-diacylglycerol--glycerol-3-phosphate 3-phosphatidyltransferase
MANLITLARFILLFVLVALAYRPEPLARFLCLPLVVVIFVGDAIDGYVARKRNETSAFGAVFDIAIDRVVENVLWLVLADLDRIPVWVAIVFITRGFLVDSIRSKAGAQGQTPFAMMRSAAGKWLVAGRFMRGFYGAAKGLAFTAVLLVHALAGVGGESLARWQGVLEGIAAALVYLCVVLCLVRGVPVVVEFRRGFGKNLKKTF